MDAPRQKKCVKECPSIYYVYFEDAVLQSFSGGINVLSDSVKAPLTEKLICIDSVDLATTTGAIIELVADEECASYYLESNPTIIICVPSLTADLAKSVVDLDVNGGNTELVDKGGTTLWL